ncbi:hypothetical protein KY319_03490 [Candidatus Woesearchaeota archaeon]|nr:hypothetical protein [Candidatus Woesearchaeota archaeon]
MATHLVNDLKQFEETISREHYLHNSGQKDELESAKIYDQFKHLFSKKHIKEAEKNLETREGKLLYDAFVLNFIGNKLKKISDKANTFEANAIIEAGGEQIPFRQVSTKIMNEDIREKRKILYNALKPTKRKLTTFEKTSWKKVYKLIEELTGKKYIEYLSFMKEVNYEELAEQLKEFLVRTEEIHKQHLEKNMATIGVRLKDTRPYDYAYFARAKPFDAFFTKEKLLPAAKKLWLDLGIDIENQQNVILDVEERPKKVPRAFCMPIKVPEEVVLVIKPRGGQDDYQAFFHESGHTEHFANTESSLSYELKHLGDNAISETYAFLIEYLLTNKTVLQKYLEMPEEEAKKFSEFIMEQKLQAFRRYAAKVIYEIKLHNNDLRKLDDKFNPTEETYKTPAKMYADILTKATKINYTPENYLLDVDSGLYAADYVRAWLFEVMLRKKLEEKFSKEWFTKEAGEYLKTFWKWGNAGKNMTQLAQMMEYEKIDISYLTEDFTEFFSKPF